MKKEITRKMKLNLPGGKVNPAVIGKDLAPTGINLSLFCQQYNDVTRNDTGKIIPAIITIFEDRSFSFVVTTPPTAFLIKEKIGIQKGAGKSSHEVVGKLNQKDLEEIAKVKLPDMNANTLEAAKKMVAGTAINMGVEVIDC